MQTDRQRRLGPIEPVMSRRAATQPGLPLDRSTATLIGGSRHASVSQEEIGTTIALRNQ